MLESPAAQTAPSVLIWHPLRVCCSFFRSCPEHSPTFHRHSPSPLVNSNAINSVCHTHLSPMSPPCSFHRRLPTLFLSVIPLFISSIIFLSGFKSWSRSVIGCSLQIFYFNVCWSRPLARLYCCKKSCRLLTAMDCHQ